MLGAGWAQPKTGYTQLLPGKFSMAKLNGWKRIGIVASVAWILGAGLYTHGVESNAESRAAVAISLDCEDYIPKGITTLAECDKRYADYLAETRSGDWIETAVVAFVPVPLGWGFVYLFLFLTRWIKRGFVTP
jgi:hypothetical protein